MGFSSERTPGAIAEGRWGIYVFCDGKLYLPEEFGPGADYAAKATEARKVFEAAEVKAFVPEMMR